jgi:hypothetical protein
MTIFYTIFGYLRHQNRFLKLNSPFFSNSFRPSIQNLAHIYTRRQPLKMYLKKIGNLGVTT